MSTGQLLLFDVRMNRPFKIIDQRNEIPIKDVAFLGENVLSLDGSMLKIWNKDTVVVWSKSPAVIANIFLIENFNFQGNLFTSIDAGNKTTFNNLCVVPRSGMLFIANENVKIQTYYIPVSK